MNKVKVMGIMNVTPDSVSDGGKFYKPEEAVRRARNLIADGADIIDIGGESTRPGSVPITWEEECSRIEPVLRQLADLPDMRRGRSPRPADTVILSVDTYHPETAERAVAAGAKLINCVYVDPVPDMVRIAAAHPDVELCIPVKAFDEFQGTALSSFPSSLLYLDPMIGFGTTREEDIELLRSIPEMEKKGRVLVGASRKRIVKKLTGEKTPGKDIAGNLAIVLYAAMNGAGAVRVHDVRETVQALRVLEQLAK